MNNKWDSRFLALASHIAQWSKDPSTKVGAVIVRPDNTICATGYNGFPRALDDSPELYEDREKKLGRVVHAEMNAILTAPEPVAGYTLYATLMPCSTCILHVIQAGIMRVVTPVPTKEQRERWNFQKTADLMREAGVLGTWIP